MSTALTDNKATETMIEEWTDVVADFTRLAVETGQLSENLKLSEVAKLTEEHGGIFDEDMGFIAIGGEALAVVIVDAVVLFGTGPGDLTKRRKAAMVAALTGSQVCGLNIEEARKP